MWSSSECQGSQQRGVKGCFLIKGNILRNCYRASWLLQIELDIDFLITLQLDEWPEDANTFFKTRKRPSGWPSTADVSNILALSVTASGFTKVKFLLVTSTNVETLLTSHSPMSKPRQARVKFNSLSSIS